MKRLLLGLAILVGCGTSTSGGGFADEDAGADATTGSSEGGGGGGGGAFGAPDAAAIHDCSPTSLDPQGCSCTLGATRPCYSGDPATRGVGACKDGAQTCGGSNEHPTWGPCSGDSAPVTESCTGAVDSNCNGKTGCADPTCASDPACDTGCSAGQTRPCYDGPTGTERVGACRDGTQACVNGHWDKTCAGEVTPQPENCCDALDHNCNHVPGCLDLLFCFAASCCQSTCTGDNVTAGCVCPQGTGDTATCPEHTHGVHSGGFPGVDECCPCTASDCGNDTNCCSETVCAGNAACSGVECKPLPPSCNGRTNADCDDFPEDCDEPCCRCTHCP